MGEINENLLKKQNQSLLCYAIYEQKLTKEEMTVANIQLIQAIKTKHIHSAYVCLYEVNFN